MQRLLIATRESRLALWQAEHVRDLLVSRFGLDVGLLGMTTRGDQILDRALSKVGGKDLVATGGHAQQAHVQAKAADQQLTHMLGLPQGQTAFTGGDQEFLHAGAIIASVLTD